MTIPNDKRPPERQIRAVFDDRTVVVYQAYSPRIAEPALEAQRFVSPFKVERMTWIKPSFLWMMYRSGWATKPDQERVLAIRIHRDGFEWALAHSCLSHYDPAVDESYERWVERKRTSPVRIQWDPERSLHLAPLDHRAIQVGLGDEAARRYVGEWVVSITDATDLATEIHALVTAGDLGSAGAKLPAERAYPLAEDLRLMTGAT
jgi:hypothetical protein